MVDPAQLVIEETEELDDFDKDLKRLEEEMEALKLMASDEISLKTVIPSFDTLGVEILLWIKGEIALQN